MQKILQFVDAELYMTRPAVGKEECGGMVVRQLLIFHRRQAWETWIGMILQDLKGVQGSAVSKFKKTNKLSSAMEH
jgi:hypothetical protein